VGLLNKGWFTAATVDPRSRQATVAPRADPWRPTRNFRSDELRVDRIAKHPVIRSRKFLDTILEWALDAWAGKFTFGHGRFTLLRLLRRFRSPAQEVFMIETRAAMTTPSHHWAANAAEGGTS
jgi:hypothetical protein